MEELAIAYEKSGRLHHAYCIEVSAGNRQEHQEQVGLLHDFLVRQLGFAVRGNPDFWHGRFESFGIDEARALKEMQLKRPAAGTRKIFLIEADSFTREAQNSLLKVFEEPTDGTHFFIFMPSGETLLPTLRSRLVIIKGRVGAKGGQAVGNDLPADLIADQIAGSTADLIENLVKKFLTAGKPERIELIKNLVEEKNKAEAFAFLDGLEQHVYRRDRHDFSGKAFSLEEMNFFTSLLKLKGYLSDRSASVKMILEHVALIAPQC